MTPADRLRAYLPHHQPAPVPPVTEGDVAHVQKVVDEYHARPMSKRIGGESDYMPVRVASLTRILAALTASRGVPEPTDEDILAVEDAVGMGTGAWDMVKATDIIRAAWQRLGVRSTPALTREQEDRLRSVLLNLAAPMEGFLSDTGSHKYVAPEVLSAMQAALADARAVLVLAPTTNQET